MLMFWQSLLLVVTLRVLKHLEDINSQEYVLQRRLRGVTVVVLGGFGRRPVGAALELVK
jgi:hypothetical protein